jgi:hypothetical protein
MLTPESLLRKPATSFKQRDNWRDHSTRTRTLARTFFTDCIAQIHRESMRAHSNPHPWMQRQSISDGYAEMVMLDPSWLEKNIDQFHMFTFPLMNRSGNAFARIDIKPVIALMESVNKTGLWPQLPAPTPSIASWLFFKAESVYACQLCEISESAFIKIANFVRMNCFCIALIESLLPVEGIQFHEDFTDQISEQKINSESNFAMAAYLCDKGAQAKDLIQWFGLSPLARDHLSASSPGRPSTKINIPSELIRDMLAGIEYSLDNDITNPAVVLFQMFRYLEMHSACPQELIRIRPLELAVTHTMIDAARSTRVRSMVRQIASLIYKEAKVSRPRKKSFHNTEE